MSYPALTAYLTISSSSLRLPSPLASAWWSERLTRHPGLRESNSSKAFFNPYLLKVAIAVGVMFFEKNLQLPFTSANHRGFGHGQRLLVKLGFRNSIFSYCVVCPKGVEASILRLYIESSTSELMASSLVNFLMGSSFTNWELEHMITDIPCSLISIFRQSPIYSSLVSTDSWTYR